MQYDPSVKIKNFLLTSKNEFQIHTISISHSPLISTIRIFYMNPVIQREIHEFLLKQDKRAVLEPGTNCIVVSNWNFHEIFKIATLLLENFYIPHDLHEAIKIYYEKENYQLLSKYALLNKNIMELLKKESGNKDQENWFMDSLVQRIKTITPVKPRYQYEGENSINPAYTNIEKSSPLCPDEKKIFVLRTDFILATGIKNVCVYEGNTDLFKVTDPAVHGYINKKDRYGHPSLAIPEAGYDGSVYYAGWLCQRTNHIKIFLQSGRFHHTDLSEFEKLDLELYISCQFMKYYGKQDILFYDCDEDEKLTLFLSDNLPQDKPFRLYTPAMMDAVFSDEQCRKLRDYENKMEAVKYNLNLSLKKIMHNKQFLQEVHSLSLNKIENLTLKKAVANRKTPCFDDIWKDIKQAFDQSMYHSYNKDIKIQSTNNFRRIIKVLIDSGIPFVDGKKLAIWSTRFARNEAVRFARKNNAVTDGMAQKYLRNILLGWPDGTLNVFYDLVKTPEPLFPVMATIFWNAMSEIFVLEMKEGEAVHLFFQDSITVGNFCWDIELPVIRKKNGKIMLHQYDLSTHLWKPPVDMDSPESNDIFLRRRSLHLFDSEKPKLYPSRVKEEGGTIIWKQEFVDDDLTKELKQWHAPKLVTLGKIKSIVNKWKEHTAAGILFFQKSQTEEPQQKESESTLAVKP